MIGFFKGIAIGFLGLVLFVAGVVFNVEFLSEKNNDTALKLSRAIEVSVPIEPDKWTATIEFFADKNLSEQTHLNAEQITQISDTFKQISQLSNQENSCIGGDFYLQPYRTDSVFTNQNSQGVRLKAKLICGFKKGDLNAFNTLLNNIDSIISKSDFVAVLPPSLEPGFSNELLESSKEKLNDELLKKVYAYEGYYSKALNKICTLNILNLNFHEPNPYAILADKSDKWHFIVTLDTGFICN